MLDGLRQLLALVDQKTLPVIATQHRVTGTDQCHLIAPATLTGPESVPGKLFLTSHRLVFASGRVMSMAWHRVRQVERAGREVTVSVTGVEDGLRLQCNTYGDALVAAYLIRTLSSR